MKSRGNKVKKLSLKTVDKNTWVRTVVLLLALANQGMIILGAANKTIDTERLTYYVSFALTAMSSVWNWWKNNSFTSLAQQADNVIHGENNSKG